MRTICRPVMQVIIHVGSGDVWIVALSLIKQPIYLVLLHYDSISSSTLNCVTAMNIYFV